MAWQKMSVELKGEEDPVVVQTNALDWRLVSFDTAAPLDGVWQATHRALVRTGANVPRDYEGFLEVLDGMPEVVEEDDLGPLDPTHAGP